MSLDLYYHAFNPARADENWQKLDTFLNIELAKHQTQDEQYVRTEHITALRKEYDSKIENVRTKALAIANERQIPKPAADATDEQKMAFEHQIFPIEEELIATYDKEFREACDSILEDNGPKTPMEFSEIPYWVKDKKRITPEELKIACRSLDLAFGSITVSIIDEKWESWCVRLITYLLLGHMKDTDQMFNGNWIEILQRLPQDFSGYMGNLNIVDFADDVQEQLNIHNQEELQELSEITISFIHQIKPLLKRLTQGDALIISCAGDAPSKILNDRVEKNLAILRSNPTIAPLL